MTPTWRALLFFGLMFAAQGASAAFEFPKNLNTADRVSLLKILGFGSQSKILTAPVPLGGYQGFEFALSSEYISTKEVGTLGSKPRTQEEINYYTLSLGKGLAYNMDLLANLTPLNQQEGVQAYGVQWRWGFYELDQFPAIFSFVFHGSGANFQNVLNTRTTGADLTLTVSIDDLSLYLGTGYLRSLGRFMGGAGGITAETTTQDEEVSSPHFVGGLMFKFNQFIVSVFTDRATQATYGASLGYRF